MKHSVALFVVFYAGIEPYLNDFLSSLREQTYKDFDLVIINDGFENEEYKRLFSDLNIVELRFKSTISKNREYGINYIRNAGYQYLILCDVDDYFSEYRVELSINSLKNCDIVVNDVNIVSSKKDMLIRSYFSKNLAPTTKIDLEFIREKNILGFSNTSIKVNSLCDMNFPENLKIVDWYFYTILLEKKLKVRYIPQALTYYRQHSGNLIGIDNFSLEQFKKLLDLKITHYSHLSEANTDIRNKTLLFKYLEMKDVLDVNIVSKISENRKKNRFPLWWENIKL